MWATYLRGDVAHLGNTTTNRLESAWGKMKPEMSHTMCLDDTIKEILLCEEIRQSESRADFDREMNELLGVVSFYAADLIYPQYTLATSVSTCILTMLQLIRLV